MADALRLYLREALDGFPEETAQELLRTYVTDKLGSNPNVARELGMWGFAGRIAPRDHGSRMGRRQRLLGYITAGRGLIVRLPPGDASFDIRLMLFDARRELQGIKVSHESLSTYELSRLFDVSAYIDREYAPAAQRAQDIARHITTAATQVEPMLGEAGHSMREALESVLGTLRGFHEYYGNEVRAFLRPYGLDAAAETGMAAIAAITSWINDEMQQSDGHIMGPERLIEMVRETEGITTTIDRLQQMAWTEIRQSRAVIAHALEEMGLPPSPDGLASATSQTLSDPLGIAAKQVPELHAFLATTSVIDMPTMGEVLIAAAEPFKPWSTAYVDHPGPFDRDRRVRYHIAMPDAGSPPEEQRANLPYEELLLLTTVHEVFPGHAVQHAIDQRAKGSPMRAIAKSTTFSEGWAHYAETLIVEAGLRNRDPRVRIAQAQKSLLRACRVIATVELHAAGRSIDDVIRMFEDIAFIDPITAKKQAYRGITEPGYLSYLIGKEKILEMRRQFMAAGLGDVRAFHRWLLSHGSPPLPMLEDELHGLIAGDVQR